MQLTIKKVVTNERYNNKYVAVDNKIFTKERAVQFFPKYKNAILKVFENSLKDEDELLPIIASKLPDNNQIIKKIEQEKQRIYKELTLKESNSEELKCKQAYSLFNYLAKNFYYDMMVQEEVNKASDKTKHDNYIITAKNKIAFLEDLNNYHINETKENQKQDLKNFLLKQKEETQKVINKANKERVKIDNASLINSIYKILVEKRGVCGNIAYTYNYLLKGLGIDNYILSIKIKDGKAEYFHGLNIIKTRQNGKDAYYAADLTYGNSAIKKYDKTIFDKSKYYLQGFYLTKEDLVRLFNNYEIIHLENTNDIDKEGKNNKKFKPYINHYNFNEDSQKEFESQMITRENSTIQTEENSL